MKKLLLILLCLPFIGFGQSKFKNLKNKKQSIRSSKKSNNLHFLDDYKILKDTSFLQILKKCEKYDFDVKRNDKGSVIHSKTGFDKYIWLLKSKNKEIWCKYIHIDNYVGLDDSSGDLNDLRIWKVETFIYTFSRYKRYLEKYTDNFHKSILESSYNQHYGSKVVYNHKDRAWFGVRCNPSNQSGLFSVKV